MLSGITLAAKAMKPSITIVAAEPCGSNSAADVAACKSEGRLIQDMPKTLTIADGLQGEACMALTEKAAFAVRVCSSGQQVECVLFRSNWRNNLL
jgi:threonine dehydratase